MMPIAHLSGVGGDGMRPAPQPPLPAHALRAPAAPFALPVEPPVSREPSALGREFEAAMLTPLVEAMLPPEDAAVWGEGGGMWRGLFAAELGAGIARAGGIGLAAMVEEIVAARRETRP